MGGELTSFDHSPRGPPATCRHEIFARKWCDSPPPSPLPCTRSGALPVRDRGARRGSDRRIFIRSIHHTGFSFLIRPTRRPPEIEIVCLLKADEGKTSSAQPSALNAPRSTQYAVRAYSSGSPEVEGRGTSLSPSKPLAKTKPPRAGPSKLSLSPCRGPSAVSRLLWSIVAIRWPWAAGALRTYTFAPSFCSRLLEYVYTKHSK